jgi:5-methyltetrahydropteroyltriglutamate--homocysteine methyltransferase
MAGGLKNMNLSQYRSWMQKRIEFLNHAQRGFPEERIRFHTCYGVNFGPRLSDLQLDQVMDPMLTIKAGAYSFRGGQPAPRPRVARRAQVPRARGENPHPGATLPERLRIETLEH